MNKKTIISLVLGCIFVLPASAQNGWFVEAGGGVQTIFSSDASKLDFGKRLTPSYTIGVGKWITPAYALRLQVGGYALNGMSTSEGLYLRDPQTDGSVYGPHDPVIDNVTVRPDGTYRHYLRYVNAHADFMVSLSRLLFHNQSKFDVLPAVGFGYAHAFAYRGTASTNSLTANFSVAVKYSVLKCMDVNLEIGSALMPDHFDGRITGKKYEPTLGATLGLTYRFNASKPYVRKERSKKHRREAVVDTVYMVERVVERPVFKDRIVEKPVAKKQEAFRLASISFAYASAKPAKKQEIVFENIVEYLKQHSSARIRLDGYADKATGKARTNLMLSIRRTDSVRNILIERYGIAPSRIDAQGIGCNAQPYEKNEHNRVVIVTALPE
ncbi:OmpA family protein [Leyella stercorea]|uniref:OmpA family protein n=1 Tax=Leyella stercorea TaxID=363265 RepID=UPI00242F7251|nr:OmpA family protein [Leyella stercorea]